VAIIIITIAILTISIAMATTLYVDDKLWIFLQNIILLPYDYLIETEEYELFETAEKNKCGYTISKNDIFDLRHKPKNNVFYYFTSFPKLLRNIYSVLNNTSNKKKLIEQAIPIIDRIKVENMFQKCYI
jgi:hypothetical protein